MVAALSYRIKKRTGHRGRRWALPTPSPTSGPIIGYTLSLIVAIFETGDFSLVPYALGAIAIAQLVDNLVLQPLIFSKSSGYHPVYVLFDYTRGCRNGGSARHARGHTGCHHTQNHLHRN